LAVANSQIQIFSNLLIEGKTVRAIPIVWPTLSPYHQPPNQGKT
jgi:hypothetical protein